MMTIIILLILAVVAISAVTGDGILRHATNARDEYGRAQENETEMLDNYISKIEENLPSGNTGGAFAKIDANDYGTSIEYSVDLNNDGNKINDWKVFYKDENNLYIIASDYLNNSLLPTGLNMSTYGTRVSYWSSTSNFTSTGSATITEDVANKYKLSWLEKNVDENGTRINNANNNAKATGDLLNTSAWTAKFGDSSKGIEAIGGPTLEMWVASWNAKGEALGTDKYVKLYTTSNTTGYKVGNQENPTTNSYNVATGTDGYKDTLYFPHTSTYGSAYGYWLASPSANSSYSVMYVDYYGYVDSNFCNNYSDAVRPLVSVPSNLVTSDAEGNLKVAQ